MGIFNNVGRFLNLDIRDYVKNFNEQIQGGLKLGVNNNYDIEGKRLANVGQGVEVHDATNMSQLTQLRSDSLQVDGSSHMTGDLDLRGNKIILPGEINMNRKLIKDLDTDENDDLSAVNMVTLKTFSSSSGDIDLQEKFNTTNSKQQRFTHLSSNYDNLVSFNDVKNIFLSRKETFPMEAGLDMGNQTIFNVKDPAVADHGVNKKYVDDETKKTMIEINKVDDETKKNRVEINRVEFDLNSDMSVAQNQIKTKAEKTSVDLNFMKLSGGTITGVINMGGEKITNLATPTSNTDAATKKFVDDEVAKTIDSHLLKNELAYLMEDADESSSECNIEVDGIEDSLVSPHEYNKKAYDLKMIKNSAGYYVSRLGFNLFKLPVGDYTVCVEFVSVRMVNLSLLLLQN